MTSAQPVSSRTTAAPAPVAAAPVTAPAPSGPAMQSAKANAADSSAPREWNPAYRRDLAALEQLVAAAAPDHAAIAKAATAFVREHNLVATAGTLVWSRSAFLPTTTSGMSSDGAHVGYAVDGIIEGHGDPVRYHTRLRALTPRVEAGELTADQARRQAAQPFLSKLGSIFGSREAAQSEFANLAEQRGVVMETRGETAVAFTTQGTFAPDYYDLSKRSWTDMKSSVVIDGKGGLMVDPFEPKDAYASLVRGLRYLGDLARYMAWEVSR